jgi:hypothetical protein
METAMQKLLEWHRKSMRSYSETNKMIEALLEKEKEQITDAYADGIDHEYTDLDIEFGISNSDRENHAKQYYNQTYNQNK